MNLVAVGCCNLHVKGKQCFMLTEKRLKYGKISFLFIEVALSVGNGILGAWNAYIEPGKGLFVY